jgi:transposase
MSKVYRPYAPRQSELLPSSPLEWLPKGHLALFILDVVEQLDLSPLYRHYERESRGYPPHHPAMMVGLLLYAYCVGVPSSRRIEKKTYEDVAFRVIAGGNHPDHVRISEFRRIHLEVLAGLFVQVLQLCQKAGLVKLGHVALDGTKMKAHASKHKAMSYERMKKQEAELQAKVEEMLRAAQAADEAEDATYGKGQHGEELPEGLRDPKKRIERIRQLKAELEAEARTQKEAEEKKQKKDEPPADGGTPLPHHRVAREEDGTPKPQAQRNFTDAASRIMKTGEGFIQGYNAQAAVDEEHQIILAQALTNQAPDVEHFVPMLELLIENAGDVPEALTADAGYFCEANVMRAAELGVEAFIATGRLKHGEKPPAPVGRPPKEMSLKQWMARRLRTKKGAATYSRRKATAEPVFGQMKEARGLRRFLLRGLAKVRAEWAFMCATHNLLKLHAALAA